MEDGVPIRAISRGVSILQAVNRSGSISLMQMSRQTSIPYPTVCRIVHTLLHEGLIEKEPDRKRYRPTILVQSLASGYQDDSRLVKAARPHIVALCKRVAWPISIATRVGNKMMVRDSTHSLTSLTLSNYFPGYTLPLAECSTGKVYLAYCSREERESIRAGFCVSEDAPDKLGLLLTQNDAMVDAIRRQGYATQVRNVYNATPGRTSSIAVPIMSDGAIVGAMALIFFAAGMKMQEAEQRYVPELIATGRAISADLDAPATADDADD